VKSGQLKGLAVTGKDRFPAVPDVPAAAESGLMPGYDVTTWYGMFAPQGTPQPIVTKLNKVLNEILADEGVKARMVSVGVVVKASTPEEFGTFMQSEFKRWEAVREAAHIERQ
jgi:tripartite-type tricarboxylate transporter receptor subunit TctC